MSGELLDKLQAVFDNEGGMRIHTKNVEGGGFLAVAEDGRLYFDSSSYPNQNPDVLVVEGRSRHEA